MLRHPGDVSPRIAWLAVGLLTIAALALRLWITRGLSLDEAISLRQASLSPTGIVADLAHGTPYPPLHALVLWATMKVLGDGELSVRIPSILAGTLVVPAVYACGRELHDRRTGVVAALFATLAPVLVWYSQEAGAYALLSLFGTLVVLFAIRALRRGRIADWLLHGAVSVAAMWTHWFAALLVAATYALLFSELMRRRRGGRPVGRDVAGALASVAMVAVNAVPLTMLALDEVHATGASGGFGGPAGAGTHFDFYTLSSNLSWAFWGFHPPAFTRLVSAVWPLLMLASLLLLGRGMSRATRWLVWCLLAPAVALSAIALANPEVFDIRYLMMVVPLLMVLAATAVIGRSRGAGARAILVVAVATLLAAALANQQLDPRNERRYDFRGALAAARARMGPSDVLLYAPGELRHVLAVYPPGGRAQPLWRVAPAELTARRVLVLGAFEDGHTRRLLDRKLGALRSLRGGGRHHRFSNVDLWTFR